MATNKRITNLTDYTSVLPYASEMFGVYQPMIGWKSKKQQERHKQSLLEMKTALLNNYAKDFKGLSQISFSYNDLAGRQEANMQTLLPGRKKDTTIVLNSGSILLNNTATLLPTNKTPQGEEWKEFINENTLTEILQHKVFPEYNRRYESEFNEINRRIQAINGEHPGEDIHQAEQRIINERKKEEEKKVLLESTIKSMINQESAIAGTLLGLYDNQLYQQLEKIFYEKTPVEMQIQNLQAADMLKNDDPFLTFDPKKDIKNVSISPLGIVHLFRQYFFELDTFLGTPTGHVWLSPGSSVELVEVSTRKTITEKTVETSFESSVKRESESKTEDELSEAVKSDNKSDTKAGFSGTVNQSWVGGSATATASINMENTQQTAREVTHKKMRQQSEKITSEIKQNYKSTFKTITEVSDTSSKRYLLNNSTPNLINYELRRKMRQVSVQVQDIGTYLCWETFVDEPGKQLGLANLVHIAKPAELEPMPDQTLHPEPEASKQIRIQEEIFWEGGDKSVKFDSERMIIMKNVTISAPDGYELDQINNKIGEWFKLQVTSPVQWDIRGKILDNTTFLIGIFCNLTIPADGFNVEEAQSFSVLCKINYVVTEAKKNEIALANAKITAAGNSTTLSNSRKENEAYLNKAKDRIKLTHEITSRKFEDLREEERIIVYRNLIKALMSDTLYNMSDNTENLHARHTLSELINSIFDVDKMLYFVAPEWWKPRTHQHQYFGDFNKPANATPKTSTNGSALGNKMMAIPFDNSKYDLATKSLYNKPGNLLSDNLVNWSDQDHRPDNYYITEDSKTARLGSSLGWLLQLDGDDLRNAFLNAPWVRAVIPIRPGKEQEAMNWLQQMNVEGTDGLDDDYTASVGELQKINPDYPNTPVSIRDAINYLCKTVSEKHAASLVPGKYPNEEIDDTNKVSATPVDKVYEHGFYPLQGGFRAITNENFEVFDQWIEVLPTDQVVPVEVEYDPISGRQKIIHA